jgi:hypothetical protein
VPTIKLHPEYASSITGSNTKTKKVASPSDDKDAGPNADKASSSKSKPNKGASNVYDERLLFGMASDLVKNVAKIMTGSLLTDVVKVVLKDKDYTWEKALYDSLIDSGPSRLFTDYINSFAVRTLSFLPPEISSQIFALPSVVFFRAATSKSNPNSKSAARDASSAEDILKVAVNEQPFAKAVDSLSNYFTKNVQPKLNLVFEKLFGVSAGVELKDAQGNAILNADGKVIKTNPKVQIKRLLTTCGAFLAGTALLPRHTKTTGTDLVKTPLRATINTISTSMFRLNTTLLHMGVGPHRKGMNFDKCYDASVQEKSLVPLIQYSADNVGALLSKYIPLNGAILGIFTRLLAEIPGTFLSAGLVPFAKEDRLSEKWRLLGQRVALPITKSFRQALRPHYKFLAQNVYSKVLGGMYNPKIKNMYDVSIGSKKMAELDPELDKKYAKGVIPTFMMLVSETLGLAGEIPKLFKKCMIQSDTKNAIDVWVQKSVNRRLDFEKKHGFKAPTHGTVEEKASLTEEQAKRVEQIEAKELSRGFKIVWDSENNGYKKINAPIPSADNDEDDSKVDIVESSSRAKLSEVSKKEEQTTKEFLLQQAA